MSIRLPPALYIDSNAKLAALIYLLKQEPIIAVDTESNSMHAYHERVCLVQISTATNDYIIDPLVIDRMDTLNEIFADPCIQKVFHAAEYDLLCLRRDFNSAFVNLFDTMIAARILGLRSVGLNNLLSQYMGVQLDKSHQLDDWGKRPLDEDSLRYAQHDTHYLLALRDLLLGELETHGNMEEALEAFQEITDDERAHEGRTFDPEGYWNLGTPNHLNPQQMAVLREVYLLREVIAQENNRPPFRILNTQQLLALAQQQPATLKRLSQTLYNAPSSIVRRYSDALLEAIQRGQDAALPQPPHHLPPPPDISDLYIALHTWRKNQASARGVESDVIISKQVLWTLAYQAPESLEALDGIKGFGPWKRAQYGSALLEVIQSFKSNKNGKHP